MVFSSITFLFFFLPVVLAVYYLVPERAKNPILLLASILFYAWGEPVYVVLLLLSIIFNYFCGREIDADSENPAKAKRCLIAAVVFNVLILFFFKYYGFVLDIVNSLVPEEIAYRELSLPVGISFYTFQEISYLVDIYRRKVHSQKNILNFALYIAMFPQLVAGPIIRYEDIEKQLTERKISIWKAGQGAALFIFGLAKKVLLADTAGKIFEQISADPAGSLSALTAWIGCISFAFQIYFDFSGYSDMAIGLGKMFGFEFRKNFDHPYVAKSVSEFWRRWHISLTSWFREYVYIPLGGNQCSVSDNIRNLLIVWLLTGMWHGAAWNYIVWGVYYGVILVMEKYVWGASVDQMPRIVRHIYTMVIVLVGWVFFFSPSLGYALRYLAAMIGGGAGIADMEGWFILTSHWLMYLAALLCSSRAGHAIFRKVIGAFGVIGNARVKYVAGTVAYMAVFAVSAAYLVTEGYSVFIYFRF